MGLHQLSDELWRERRLLDLLLFKLEQQELLLSNGRDQWIGHATRELEAVLDRVRGSELARAIAADVVALLVGAPSGSSLTVLAAHAPSPWDELLLGHHEALVSLTADISRVATDNRLLIAAVQRATRQSLVDLRDTQHDRSAPRTAVDDLEIALGPISVGALLDQIALDLLAEGSLAGIATRRAQIGATTTAVELQARQADLASALRATSRAVQPSLQAFLTTGDTAGAPTCPGPSAAPSSGSVPQPRTARTPFRRHTDEPAAQMWRSAGPS
ncbi:MAG: FlgN family protein [Actinotalea sp.]|nr:FlgN family protein [Actinotalea sp.]